ncbi:MULTISPECIES: hypothetical protein [unclassified Lactobacillus]|uniref:hypothetical protein n=1 Tax=unclassified Lactobacillus TaxID=2620435 RepID=UPI002269E26D|nr:MULTISPECIES: hypothetical protein [unclassified Lactobacillus]MCX8720841.1 hypothetical protein [Lactobacillus sp. B4010]MCX8723115.1 hypothetical protein [Lactobacillus sp. B4005]MCX8732568.1 hypothetical protein [Lactobacillus sp. B4015]MCX8734788.1 hypothetical protein [Lactobacillus sp. B4012]
MQKAIKDYSVTLTFFILAVLTSVGGSFKSDFKPGWLAPFFVLFVFITAFGSEFLANKTTSTKFKGVAAAVTLIVSAMMLWVIYFVKG